MANECSDSKKYVVESDMKSVCFMKLELTILNVQKYLGWIYVKIFFYIKNSLFMFSMVSFRLDNVTRQIFLIRLGKFII